MSDKLSTYRAKRDFRQTAEPKGSRRGTARSPTARRSDSAPRLRFVIQKHAATRLHYDLRLELDGVFKSWAVTRGPSLDPADKRLAVEVEDHPLEYGDFEGTIPKGQYGGGTVQLWDRGYWSPLPGVDPGQALKSGELKFVLEGKRLHGSWVLVRMRHDKTNSKRTNWLLIKHRDEAADPQGAAALLEQDRSVASGRRMAAIAAGTGKAPAPFMAHNAPRPGPDAQWNSSSASTSRSTPMPAFIEPQLATLVEHPPSSPGWVHEVKLDGYRLQVRVENGKARLLTRSGLDWTTKFPQVAAAAKPLPDCIIDGEVVALDAHRVPSFADLQAALSEHETAGLTFFAFDLLYLQGVDLRSRPLAERKRQLSLLLDKLDSSTLRYLEHFEAGAEAVLNSACRMSLEGIVSKRLDDTYTSGRSGRWSKAKCRTGHEVVIGGYSFRDGALRSLLVGVHRKDHLVYVGRVGTGFGARSLKLLWPRVKALTTRASPFSGAEAPRGGSEVRWVKPELVAEIEFAGWTDSGMVRQAAFKGLREDKPAMSVQAERPSKLRRADVPALPGRARATRAMPSVAASVTPAGGNTVMGVTISTPDKSLWPDANDGRPVSKLELARYYEAVGAWMLPHIAGRPCSLVRAPDGIGGQRFFQRHAMPGQSNLFEMMTVSGDRKPYLVIDRVEALIAAAQSAAVELHPWNSAAGEPDVPGRLVFDLDPSPELDFQVVIDAALELKARLEALGLTSFCKTTGGKGLHVVTPLLGKRDRLDWAAAKTFAHAVCVRMAEDNPDRYLTTMAKKLRGGRIFLDYLRNDRMATAVAPLSPRARQGATVSMPLPWAQIRKGLDPSRFTVRTVAALLQKSRPWEGYDAAAASLRTAISRFTQSTRTPATRTPATRRPATRRKSAAKTTRRG